MSLNIAIIGAGPVGLTLARLLLASPSNVNVTIFERDASASAQMTKGGTLDLHADTGLAALDAAGLREAFDRVGRYDPLSGGTAFADREGNRVFEMPISEDEANKRPEIDRGDLRTLLLDGIPEGTIQWGARVTSIASDGTLSLEGGREVDVSQYDLVVGADGAWSKVRAHMNAGKPVYSGLGGFEMHIEAPDVKQPGLASAVGHGLLFAVGGGRGIVGQRLGSGAIMLYAMIRTQGPEDIAAIVDSHGGDWALVKEHVKGIYEAHGWGKELLGWFDAAEPATMRAWPLYEYELPNGHVWEHVKGMRDALELSKRICASETGDQLDAAVKEYEEEMFARLRPYMFKTIGIKDGLFSEGAPGSYLDTLREVAASGDH
ncbi:hypothetical protein H0H81_008433 [Sphagnurus paluster]|uniref:FAD-binding domain-containing protein n=1 Tax=Sphagnurus paluster TaxID=117069 RepID=A0A9P7FSM8_9AGAR|nr:hypothetical protein H0H81_008433 [Sphagnurus paluster]